MLVARPAAGALLECQALDACLAGGSEQVAAKRGDGKPRA